MVTVTGVENDSPFFGKVIPGDALISVNGHEIRDVLDYRYYTTVKNIECVFCRDGERFVCTAEKDEYDDPGLDFSTFLMDKKRSCRNKCVFCFIDQNPKGMRDSVYFKDDDERLSFLQGSYITLTNLSDEDVERIIKMKITPINVSVHTMEPALRVMMTGNRFAGDSLKKLWRLAEGGTGLNLQFVLCRGINDGEHLKYSLKESAKLKTLISASVVPAGITSHREGLYPLEPYDKASAAGIIDEVEAFHAEQKKLTGSGKYYCSDEFYLLAGRELPPASYYEGFDQYDNGVGMLSDMEECFEDALESTETSGTGRIDVATGFAAYPLMSRLAQKFENKFPGRQIVVHRIVNEFFGPNVTVSGLLTGSDYAKQLKGKVGGVLLISRSSLNADGKLFLDDMTPGQLERELGVRLYTNKADGYDLCAAFAADYTEN